MISRMVLVCVGVATLHISACAQGVDAPATVGYVKQALEENNAKLISQFREMMAERDPLQGAAEPQSDKPRNLEERVARLEKQMGNHGTALGQIAMQDEAGGYHVRFDTNSQTARHEVKRAMDSTVPEFGKLIISNKTNHDEWIVINGEQKLVLAGATLNLDVKPGTVTSRLRHEQQPTTIYVGFPKYTQMVHLVERPLIPYGWVSSTY